MINFDYPDGASPLDPDEIDGLLLTHITTREQLNRWEQENINEAIEWAYIRKHRDIISATFMKRLHKKMFGNVWKWAGQFRKSDKNIGIAWWEIPLEVKKLCDDTTVWIEQEVYASDELGVRFHHRLAWIHPFPNGNGRHARLMTDLTLEQILNQPGFTWGGESLVQTSDCRSRYIKALYAADRNDFSLLMKFVRS